MDHCSICNSSLPEGEPEVWRTTEGDEIKISKHTFPSVVAETSLGEFTICEACYLKCLPTYFTPSDIASIHYEFGIEYGNAGDHERQIESLRKAQNIEETADILAMLAVAENACGRREKARLLYRKALLLEPEHFMARENLKNLE